MGSLIKFTTKTVGEKFYDITEEIRSQHHQLNPSNLSGVLIVYLPHTSAALCINENFEATARNDMQNFLSHLAPENLSFITHKSEGIDDSPSHMKAILLQNSLLLIVEKGEIILGQWQGIYLCEFRKDPKARQIILKFQAD